MNIIHVLIIFIALLDLEIRFLCEADPTGSRRDDRHDPRDRGGSQRYPDDRGRGYNTTIVEEMTATTQGIETIAATAAEAAIVVTT